MNIRKGTIFYRYLNNELEQVRVYKIQNSETVCIEFEDGRKEKITASDLYKYFTMLNPDGYVSFTRVKMNGSQLDDVIITFHRRMDILQNNQPYAVCRQAITDLYTNLINRESEIQYIGCSVSIDTCPEDVDFRLCTACDEVVSIEMISFYIGDTIDTALGFVKTKAYDSILQVMKNQCNTNILGCCTSVKELLMQNNFEYDVLRGLDIQPISFKIELEKDENGLDSLSKTCTTQLEDILKRELKTTIVVPYSKEIDMKDIQMDHVLVRDSNNDIYIVGYVGGERVNHSYNALEDKRDYILMNDLKYSKLNH